MHPAPTPRYIRERAAADPAGLAAEDALPLRLPYGLKPRDFLRTVEDVHDLIADINSLLHERSYRRVESLLDPAGFSGLVSRTVAERLASASRALVLNRHHNGYPDLLVDGQYPGNAAEHGEGGLEVKASRFEGGWQSHGPRAGWFAVVQFELDEREDVAAFDLSPTRVRSVLVAPLDTGDWSWQPAAPGKIRSGTASVRPSGVVKLRAGAVWVDPTYRARHEELLTNARMNVLRSELPSRVLREIEAGAETAEQVAQKLASDQGLPLAGVQTAVRTTLKRLAREGTVAQFSPGRFRRP